MKRPHVLSGIPAVVGILVTLIGCGGPSESDVAALRAEIGEIKQAHQELVAAVADLEKRAQAASRRLASLPPPAGEPVQIPIKRAPRLGKAQAPVTVVEFADFQCPFCKSAYQLPAKLVEEFPDDVQVVFKHYPLHRHPGGVIASKAAWAAQQQGKFWEMHDLIYGGDINAITPELLRGYAEQLGLDLARFDQDAVSSAASLATASDKKLGRKLRVPGTPAYFVNGRPVVDRTPAGLYRAVADAVARTKG